MQEALHVVTCNSHWSTGQILQRTCKTTHTLCQTNEVICCVLSVAGIQTKLQKEEAERYTKQMDVAKFSSSSSKYTNVCWMLDVTFFTKTYISRNNSITSTLVSLAKRDKLLSFQPDNFHYECIKRIITYYTGCYSEKHIIKHTLRSISCNKLLVDACVDIAEEYKLDMQPTILSVALISASTKMFNHLEGESMRMILDHYASALTGAALTGNNECLELYESIHGKITNYLQVFEDVVYEYKSAVVCYLLDKVGKDAMPLVYTREAYDKYEAVCEKIIELNMIDVDWFEIGKLSLLNMSHNKALILALKQLYPKYTKDYIRSKLTEDIGEHFVNSYQFRINNCLRNIK